MQNNYFGITVLTFCSLLGCNAKNSDTSHKDSNTASCFNDSTPMDTFELFPNQPTTQIHADIAFDGQWIWTVFNLPNDDADFDVFLVLLIAVEMLLLSLNKSLRPKDSIRLLLELQSPMTTFLSLHNQTMGVVPTIYQYTYMYKT